MGNNNMHKKLSKLNKQLYAAFGSLVALSFLNISHAQTETVVVTGDVVNGWLGVKCGVTGEVFAVSPTDVV